MKISVRYYLLVGSVGMPSKKFSEPGGNRVVTSLGHGTLKCRLDRSLSEIVNKRSVCKFGAV